MKNNIANPSSNNSNRRQRSSDMARSDRHHRFGPGGSSSPLLTESSRSPSLSSSSKSPRTPLRNPGTLSRPYRGEEVYQEPFSKSSALNDPSFKGSEENISGPSSLTETDITTTTPKDSTLQIVRKGMFNYLFFVILETIVSFM
ncbi:uncharacterized protein [Lepeophtheirus salmonis]|uniref:uncharacterized protein isoform X2 n=1 Tax=Lepeophtheirus salmonis TaxID=72036 RepID=UPI003AF33ED0